MSLLVAPLRDAGPSDRAELCVFECTEPGVKRQGESGWYVDHPRLWELKVQSKIRTLAKHVRFPAPGYVLLGHDPDGLAAVAYYEEQDGPAEVEIHLAAIALRLRRKGGGCADEMVTGLLDRLTARAIEAGVAQVVITTKIDEHNGPSQGLCRRFGLWHTGILPNSTLQQWSGILPTGGDFS